MTKSTDPADMSRDQRIAELASILARGVIRLLDPAQVAESSATKKAQISSQKP